MLGLVIWESWDMIMDNITYGFWPWAGVVVTALLLVVFTIIVLITGRKAKKATTVKKVRRGTAVMVVSSVLLTAGVWGAIDVFLPDILSDATSGTIKYTDLIENYEGESEYFADMLDEFITMNVANGNLSEYTLEEYLAMGFTQEVSDLIDNQYYSQHRVGYTVINANGPWLTLADSDRMTIAAVVHLVINQRDYSYIDEETGETMYKNEKYQVMVDGEYYDVTWTILDMTNPITLDLTSLLGDYSDILSLVDSAFAGVGGLDALTEALHDVLYEGIASEEVAGDAINIYFDLDGEDGFMGLIIDNTTEERGVFDYMHTAWFQSNGLLIAVTHLYATRHIIYFFAGIVAILALMLGFMRESQYKANFVDDKKDDEEDDSDDDNNVVENAQPAQTTTPIVIAQSPYLTSFMEAQNRRVNENTINK